jgi:hypothetical protein
VSINTNTNGVTNVSGDVTFETEDGVTIKHSATGGTSAEYIGNNNVLLDGNDKPMSLQGVVTTIERTTYRDYNINTRETIITVITKTTANGEVTYTRTITVTDADRQGLALYEAQDREKYNRRTFSMFTGEETTVVLEFDGALAGAVIDRFGKDTMFIPGAKGCFRIQVPVAVSPPFFGWLASFGGRARILSPASVIDAYREQLQKCMP